MLSLIMRIITSINQSSLYERQIHLGECGYCHEVLHSIVHDKKEGHVLKLDYDKAFDKVDVVFLLDIL